MGGHTFDTVGENFIEDDVYDQIDKICDADEIYSQHELVERKGDEGDSKAAGFDLVKVANETLRSEHTVRWQNHAMKELCDNVIKPNDDEIKDMLLKGKRKKKAGKASTLPAREAVVK